MSAFLPKTDVYRTSSQGGRFVFNSHSVRMNQAHRSAAIVPQRFDHPHHGLERTHSLMIIGGSALKCARTPGKPQNREQTCPPVLFRLTVLSPSACFAPKGYLVAGDVMLAQKIALEDRRVWRAGRGEQISRVSLILSRRMAERIFSNPGKCR
jgi:hypothetical protein